MPYINGQAQVQAVANFDGTNMVAQFDQAYAKGYQIRRVIILGPQCPTGSAFKLYLGGITGLLIATTPKTDVNDAAVSQYVQPYQNVFAIWENVNGPATCTLVLDTS